MPQKHTLDFTLPQLKEIRDALKTQVNHMQSLTKKYEESTVRNILDDKVAEVQRTYERWVGIVCLAEEKEQENV